VSEPKEKNYYEMLGISFYSSIDDIQRAAENALRRCETIGADPNDPAVAAEIAAKKRPIMMAYATLKDPEKRRLYNASLSAKISEAARVANPLGSSSMSSTSIASNASTATSAAKTVGALQSSPSAAALNATANTTAPTAKYQAPDLRSSIQQRLDEGEVVYSHTNDTLNEPAHLGVRFVAMVIDSVIVTSLWFAIALIAVLKGGGSAPGAGFMVVFWMIPIAYYAICESGKHRSTWGKRWMGLRVCRSDGETSVGLLRAAGRYVLRGVSSIFLLGYIMAFFSERKQALHDLASDTVVFQAEDPPAYWVLAGIASVFVIPIAFALFGAKLARSFVQPLGGQYAQLLKDERTDPSRASPDRDEVQLAYRTGVMLQRVLKERYATDKRWPQPAEREQLIAQSARPQLLVDHNVIVLPEGSFALSLGATAKGTARMIFQAESDSAETEWSCTPVNIAKTSWIEQCSGE
jgi:uncharacterized RDD family membrane protein YckC